MDWSIFSVAALAVASSMGYVACHVAIRRAIDSV